MKNQDKLGIFAAIGISILAVGFGFFGNSAIEKTPIQGQNIEVTGIGGITDIKESIKISMDNPSIDLDTTDGLFRANVVYEGYQPQMGRVMLEVYSATGEKIKTSELQLRQRGNDVYEADFMQYFDKNEFLGNESAVGQYIMRVSTEQGTLAKQAPFAIKMSSMEQPQEVMMVQSNVITTSGIGGKLSEDAPKLGFDLEVMEKDLENSIIKKYLSKILKEYYNGDISKDEIKRLTQFKNIECDLTNGMSQTGESLQLSCEFKSEN